MWPPQSALAGPSSPEVRCIQVIALDDGPNPRLCRSTPSRRSKPQNGQQRIELHGRQRARPRWSAESSLARKLVAEVTVLPLPGTASAAPSAAGAGTGVLPWPSELAPLEQPTSPALALFPNSSMHDSVRQIESE
jgi:hypothetical protein